ncbi:A-kinase anchor protein 10, mitochondrial-like isoform X1 [Procambarus clarkii]|uniref:A-kinase anchor protein 10, mitochondrial n=1 Tax=Procambarus clarkii TaxID=6728 RepID=UPI001E67664C|nr:A-kinase anchor protein 10, mitochondrial-like isoform X2 [Procambarus clarkii]
MSSLWRKFRGGVGAGGSPNHANYHRKGNPQQVCQEGAPSVLHDPGILKVDSTQIARTSSHTITQTDEQHFMSDSGQDRVDPLLIQSQFVKTVEDILSSPSTLPYFLQFLQGWGADKYARFWMDTNSFSAAAVTRINSQDFQVSYDNPSSMPGNIGEKSNKEKYNKTLDSDQRISSCDSKSDFCKTHSLEKFSLDCSKDIQNTRDKSLILPDLVSSIENASDVTPLNTPDGSSSKVLTCRARTSQEEQISVREKENVLIQQKNIEMQPSNSAAQDTSTNESSNSSLSASQCLQAQKLRQSIADDAMRIFNKYLAKDAEHSVGVNDAVVDNILQNISIVQEDIDPNCFMSAQKIVFSALEQEFLPKFLASDYYLKHQIDVLTSGSVRLADILYSDSAFPYFMEYVEQEGGRNMLQLWVAVSNFRQQLMEQADLYDSKQAQADAMILYDKYFSLQAMCPLGFSDSVRFIVEGNICREKGPLPSCFDLPLRVVLHILERDFLPGYLSSNLHIKYLSELINTVKTSVELLGRKKRSGSESTCSSEQSSSCGGAGISTHNTLLAMDTSAPHRFRNLDDPTLAMRIDEAQITDPDSLWRRKNFSKMSCGYINELGRFESDLQPEPDRKTESKISKTLKKFVNMDEDKVKEDMAYKVAEMIIKDVTSVTLSSQHSGRSSVESSAPPLSPSSVSQDNLSDVFSS